VRISSFLNPCDSQLYKRRKEEDIKCYVSLENLSQMLNISKASLRQLCWNKEIPFYKIRGKYFFWVPDINNWLKHHLESRKKIKEVQKEKIRIFGIEPLITQQEASEILGCSTSVIYRLRGMIPHYKIGGRYRFKLSDLENYREKERVDFWEVPTRIGKWRSSYFWREPTKEEKLCKEESYTREYNENARPGYIVRKKYFYSPDFIDLKQDVEDFIKKNIPVKTDLLGKRYFVIDRKGTYGCLVEWWGLPEGRENYKIHSTGLSDYSPEEISEKVDNFIKRKVKSEDIISVEFYTFGSSFTAKCHCARVTYYLPKDKKEKLKN